MDGRFSIKKQGMGLLFGAIAGLSFSTAAWGIDAIQLVLAHASSPLIKFIPGLIISVLAGALAGWLTIKIERVWAAIVLWELLAGLYTWLVIWLPLNGVPFLLKVLEPQLAPFLYFPDIESQTQFVVIGLVVIGFVCLICGLMEIHLIDQALLGRGTFSLISPLLISLIAFVLAGSAGDYLINRHFREPVLALNELIEFAADNQGVEFSPLVSRQKRLAVVRDLDDIITYPRKLTLIAYDSMLGQMDIMVDFDGNWVRCSVIYSQPTMCKRILLDSLRFACEGDNPSNDCFNPIGYEKSITKTPDL